MKYTVKCPDGSDNKCHKEWEEDLDLIRLTDENLEEIEEGCEFIKLSQEQVDANKIKLNKEEKDFMAENGYIEYEICREEICDPCGSGESYDNEGKNITGE